MSDQTKPNTKTEPNTEKRLKDLDYCLALFASFESDANLRLQWLESPSMREDVEEIHAFFKSKAKQWEIMRAQVVIAAHNRGEF